MPRYHIVSPTFGRTVTVRDEKASEDREMLMFAASNPLGLVAHPYVVERVQAAIFEGVVGDPSRPSRQRELEERLAAFAGTGDAALYATGYQTTVGLLSGLVGPRDVAYCDEQSQPATFDGLSVSQGTVVRIAHNDPDDLARHLDKHWDAYPNGAAYVCVAGVYPLAGDSAPLGEIVPLAKRHGAFTIVDEAHGLGVLGRQGRGAASRAGVSGHCDVLMGTFDGVFGVEGGVACASRTVLDYLRAESRAGAFSAPPSPAAIAAVLACLDLLERGEAPLDTLRANVAALVSRLRDLGLDVQSGSSVVPVPLPAAARSRVMRSLYEEGIVAAATPSGLDSDQGRLLLHVTAAHTPADLDRVAEQVAGALVPAM